MMTTFSVKKTHLAMTTAGFFSVENGLAIRVHSIEIANGSAQNVNYVVANSEGTTLMTITVPFTFGSTSFITSVPFIADKGIQISSSLPGANQFATVFHSHPGS